VGDGIENPWNALTMLHAAEMFGARCAFRDRKGLTAAWEESQPAARSLPLISLDNLARACRPVIAFENLEGAREVYGHKPGPGPRPALLVGNERRGLARDAIALATESVHVPLASRSLTSLNVAAAAAVGLYYLGRGGAPMQRRSAPEQRRPELLLLGTADHWELGSAIRSAAAFGWQRVWLDDRAGVWFGAGRIARGAAIACGAASGRDAAMVCGSAKPETSTGTAAPPFRARKASSGVGRSAA
jgi:tRNA G18 (ribose-2'-O)-methylase SpoU